MTINDVEVIDNKCTVPLITFDKPTCNNYIFSRQVVQKCILDADYINEKLKHGVLLGELYHDFQNRISELPYKQFICIHHEYAVMKIHALYYLDSALRGDIEIIKQIPDGEYKTAYRIIVLDSKMENGYHIINNFTLITFDLMTVKDFYYDKTLEKNK